MASNRYASVGIIGALEKEVQTIFENLEGAELLHEDGLEVASGSFCGIDVVATVAGMGTVNAAAAAQSLISRHNVDAVIFSGIAGGLNPALHIEDVVVGDRLLYLDTDTQLVAESAPGLEEFASSGQLADIAEGVLKARGYAEAGAPRNGGESPLQFLRGAIATGDRFVGDPVLKAAVIEATGADCVEMEGAAVAHVSAKNGVDCLVMRAISDNCDEAYDALSAREFDLEEYTRNASGITLDILRELARP